MPLIDKLKAVSEVDVRRLALERKLADLPNAPRAVEAKADVVRATLARQKEEQKKGTLEMKRLEGEVKAKQQEVDKTEAARNQARANDEFQAHGKKIQGLKVEIGDLETKILEEMERQDQRAKDRTPLEKKLAELEAEARATRAQAEVEGKALRAQLAEVQAERRELLSVLGKDELSLYERALERHGDRAVISVVDGYCQGCLVSIRPNQAAQLRGGEQIVTCWECGRMLYSE